MFKSFKRKKKLVERGPRLLLPPVMGYKIEKVLLQNFVIVKFSIINNAIERCNVRLKITNILLQKLFAIKGPIANAVIKQKQMRAEKVSGMLLQRLFAFKCLFANFAIK